MDKIKEQSIPVFESELKTDQLLRLRELLGKAYPKLVGIDGEEVYLPESIYQILIQVTPILAQGKGVILVPQDHYLTTQEAANILNVSRPFLYTLLDQQQIAYTKIGTHRRIKVEDILAYKKQKDEERRQTLAELVEYTQELGFYEAE